MQTIKTLRPSVVATYCGHEKKDTHSQGGMCNIGRARVTLRNMQSTGHLLEKAIICKLWGDFAVELQGCITAGAFQDHVTKVHQSESLTAQTIIGVVCG